MEKKTRSYFLVDPDITRVGDIFSLSHNDICKSCKYFKICFGNKRLGISYKVMKLIKPKYPIFCKLIEKYVYLAEVEEAPVRISINSSNLPLEVPVIYSQINCAEKHCPYIKYCVYNGRFLGNKVVIKKVLEKLDCPIGLDLHLVEVFPHR